MTQTGYIKKQQGAYTLYISGAFCDTLLDEAVAQGLASMHKFFELEKIPSSRCANVYKFDYSADGQLFTFYFKQFLYRSLWDICKHIFRPSRSKRAMLAANMLEQNGFATPAVVAIGERRRFGFCQSNFMLTVEAAFADPLDMFFREKFVHVPAPLESKRDFFHQLGHFAGRLHEAGISHGDLRVGNILVSLEKHIYKFLLLDNERTLRYKKLPEHLRIKNLVQLNLWSNPEISRTDRLRFFRCYAYENSIDDWKPLARKVMKRTMGRIADARQRKGIKVTV